jgi:hypothetical protein
MVQYNVIYLKALELDLMDLLDNQTEVDEKE